MEERRLAKEPIENIQHVAPIFLPAIKRERSVKKARKEFLGNEVNFEPTHELTTELGETITVMLVDGAAYQAHEWIESMAADITNYGIWESINQTVVSAKKLRSKKQLYFDIL